MDTFLIKNVSGGGGLEFFDRSPGDPGQPIEEFWVRIVDDHLSATARVWARYAYSHPASIFANMARQWTGWKGEITWESLEYELALRCAHDRLGHIRITAELRSGMYDDDWQVRASVITEAGQLDRLAQQAKQFFGEPRKG